MRLFFTIGFIFITLMADAQHLSQLGRYSVPYSKACAPVTINISVEDNFGNVPRTYIYEEGLIDVTDTFHTFSNPGIYKIVQVNGANVSPKTDTLVFEVMQPRPPEFNVFKCTATSVQVEITDNYYDYFTVKFTASDSTIVTATGPSPTFDYSTSSGSVQVIGRFNNGYPNCSDTFKAFQLSEPQDANLISANISQGCQNQFVLDLNITVDTLTRYQVMLQQGAQSYSQVYEGKLQTGLNNLPVNFNPAITSYCVRLDKMDACSSVATPGVESCYTLDANSFNPLSASYATYQGDMILVNFDPTVNNEIQVDRKYGASADFGFYKTVQNPFTDNIGTHYRAYSYKLFQIDTCGFTIDSAIVSAPFLKIEGKNKRTNEMEISVTDPINQLSTSDLTLIIFNSDSSEAVEIPYSTNFTLPAQIGDELNIVVRFDYSSEVISIYSNTITTSYEYIVYVPQGFTPNGDGLNDQLELFALPTTSNFQISIYNRWGALIHQSENENPAWDGNIDGQQAPEGTYRYKLVFSLPDGRDKTQVGTFALIP